MVRKQNIHLVTFLIDLLNKINQYRLISSIVNISSESRNEIYIIIPLSKRLVFQRNMNPNAFFLKRKERNSQCQCKDKNRQRNPIQQISLNLDKIPAKKFDASEKEKSKHPVSPPSFRITYLVPKRQLYLKLVHHFLILLNIKNNWQPFQALYLGSKHIIDTVIYSSKR